MGDDYETDDHTAICDCAHELDLAEGDLGALNYALKQCGCEIFGLWTGVGYYFFYRASRHSSHHLKKSIRYELLSQGLGNVCKSVANSEKARWLLGWVPKFKLDDMYRDAGH